jgi:hypothetical protein
MMDSTDRNGELVAHASSECTRLCKREVMRIGWDAAAHKAGLPEREPAVLLIAEANRFASKHDRRALVSLGLVFPGIRGPCLKSAPRQQYALRLNGTRSPDIRGSRCADPCWERDPPSRGVTRCTLRSEYW